MSSDIDLSSIQIVDETHEKARARKETYTEFAELHRSQLINSGVPELYWPKLFNKLSEEIYDAGNAFEMKQVLLMNETEETIGSHWIVCATSSVCIYEPQHIYLIDHAWTYNGSSAEDDLKKIPGLLERMAALMDIETETKTKKELIDTVLETMWQFNQTYRFGNFELGSDDSMPKWYIMDEFGSRIRHSEEPNFRVVPFYHINSGLVYSIMWPVREIEVGDEITRDYIEGETNPTVRLARLMPWEPVDLMHISYTQEEPSIEYFSSYTQIETQPSPNIKFIGPNESKKLKVFLEYDKFSAHLTDPRFELVDNPDDADILWYFQHFHQFYELSLSRPNCMVNQFPCENVITVKDLLAIVARRAAKPIKAETLSSNPKWLPVTYNLKTELAKFVSYYQHREKRGLDNFWICKPWNLARGLDTYISKNLAQIVRLPDSGPKVACKYIENPVLFHRSDVEADVKFDIRYLVLLTSIEPLQLFTYQVFWLRFANKPYSLNDLYDYEKHFTVMNYVEGAETKLKQMHYNDFIPEFEKQNEGFFWKDIEKDIFTMIKELFQAATKLPAPQGIGRSPQSRAMYAVDLMLAWDTDSSGNRVVQPMLCEVNFSPDCARACKYHPSFVNDIFSVLFLNDTDNKHVVEL
ncbi:tubulin--tyrosine ligase protein 12 [Biomphalaria glabrata]|nr:tubulin--tyrosine ligase protein 12 [Biomphalaria glabrata]